MGRPVRRIPDEPTSPSSLLAVLLHGTLVLRTEIEGDAYATMQYSITLTTVVIAAVLDTPRAQSLPNSPQRGGFASGRVPTIVTRSLSPRVGAGAGAAPFLRPGWTLLSNNR